MFILNINSNNTMKYLLLFLTLLSSSFGYAQTTDIKYLSGKGSDDAIEWNFFCTEGQKSGKWDKIKVPSCWEMEGFGTLNYGHDKTKAAESGLYKTTFEVPSTWKKKRVFIVFEGVMTDTEIRVNGKAVNPIHQGGFYRFKREITKQISWNKKNLLEVKVNKMSANTSINEAERGSDFWVFGGIFRPVYLEAVPEHFIDYTAIDARQHGELTIDIFMDKKLSDIRAEVEIKDSHKQTMGKIASKLSDIKNDKITISGKINNIKPWSAEDPILYTAVITVWQKNKILHTITDRIGFRTVEVKPKDGVYINGVKMLFKGVNRHSHWPTTGRTTNKQLSIQDVKLMKEMNMNAVRMSHYPPDKHFLEVCDSLGMYVIDELCSWQYPPYDTKVGTILVGEMLKRDLNRPSIIFWANGNEGGFNFDLDPLFYQYDPQKRTVLHPWDSFGEINTAHYIKYDAGINSIFHGRDIFMPTEVLHGLYDGGNGAGLDDYWNLMLTNPVAAGMFLWDFTDQAVVRKDKNGFLDTDKDHGADGITGPFREKEGSFFAIKEIWSPIQIKKRYITPNWNGCLEVENRYAFTNANECNYTFKLTRINSLSKKTVQTISGKIKAPNINPGGKGSLQLELPQNWQEYDFLYITVKDRYNQELFTWSFEVSNPDRLAHRLLPHKGEKPLAKENVDNWCFYTNNLEVQFNKRNGLLQSVTANNKVIPLNNGPLLITSQNIICESVEYKENKNSQQIVAVYINQNKKDTVYTFTWSMLPSGIIELEYKYRPLDKVTMAGITFDFPEKGIDGVTLLANGPYRVYNNRMKGGSLDIWEKKYNNTVTGESWEYPEFKGYYSLFYGMRLNCSTPFEVYSGKEDLTLHLFTPDIQKQYDKKRNNTIVEYPKGNLSFMNAIPAIGSKFGKADNFGPQSQPHRKSKGYVKGKLYFHFL